jgi:hypothetical protein
MSPARIPLIVSLTTDDEIALSSRVLTQMPVNFSIDVALTFVKKMSSA